MATDQKVTQLSSTAAGAGDGAKTAAQLVVDDGEKVLLGWIERIRRIEKHVTDIDEMAKVEPSDAMADDMHSIRASSLLGSFRGLNGVAFTLQRHLDRVLATLEKTI